MKNLFLLVPLLIVGCSAGQKDDIMKGKFGSMEHCLASMKTATEYSNLRIKTDKPNNVSGFIGDTTKHYFNCEVKETGSEGTYVEGWYTKPKS